VSVLRAFLTALVLAGVLAPRAGTQLSAQLATQLTDEPDDGTRFFALPMVRDTRELAAVADEHLRAERYSEAIGALQRIVEEHAQEVLPAGTELGRRSTYAGAGEWALARLAELPEAARAEYGARFEPRAAEALARARRTPTRAGLAAIPRRWPLAPAAAAAWWALGDLELESGRAEAAGLAWRNALALEHRLGLATDEARAARRAWLEARVAALLAVPRAAPALPRSDAQAWTTPLDLTPFANVRTRNLQPVVAGDVVLVGSTLRLFALDAFSGELRWQAGPPAGWGLLPAKANAELFDGINNELLLAPAAGDGIALAVMQQPFTEYATDDWQGIEIMKAIPERRLYAYDLATGRELWNHAPRLATDGLRPRWDGTGTYAERMMVAGTPTVAGARVLVPCYRMQGRIDYHVACYELASGELLWSTLVISGQRERNMFGRPTREFVAAPLVVSGARVFAQTELGTLAALDLFGGRILWQTTYAQIPLPKTKQYNAPPRPLTWRLAPPVVAGEVLVATPSDSTEVVGLRLADGTKLWSYSAESLQERDRENERLGFNQLVGADADTLFLSGAKLAALQKAGGLATSAPFQLRWSSALERSESAPRALLTDEHLLAPNEKQRVVLARRTGERVPALSGGWGGGEAGSLALEDGALFALSAQGLSGYFDWPAQLERARRLAESAEAPGALQRAAELFLRHGSLALERGDAVAARGALADARAYFERLRARDPRADPRAELACVRALAESQALLGGVAEALDTLAGARALATSPSERAGLLLQEERLLRPAGGAARLSKLDELGSGFGELLVPAEVLAESAARWLADGRRPETPAPRPDALPIATWVALERANERERAGELGAALADLHDALARSGPRELARGLTLAGHVNARVARILALPGGEAAYASLEAEAGARLARARSSGDAQALAELGERFPHSRAAEEALGLLLERAAAEEDAPAVVRLVRGALERGGLTPAREVELLLVLGRALGANGNAALEAALIARLARAAPMFVSPLAAHGGRTLAALAAELAPEAGAPPTPNARFTAEVLSAGRAERVALEHVGFVQPEGAQPESAPLELALFAARDELRAYASTAPHEPRWTRVLTLANPPVALAPGRIVLGTEAGLECLDAEGRVAWRHATPGDPPRACALADGVVVALTRGDRVLALDAALGLALWQRVLGSDEDWSGPLAGDGHVVLFAQAPRETPRALVLDLFRGRLAADLALAGVEPRAPLAGTAWIAERRLIAPAFGQRPGQFSAFELEGGTRAWTLELGKDEELQAVVHNEGRAFAVALAVALGAGSGNGGVYELDPKSGTLRRVVPLRPGERIMGLEPGAAVTLASPYLFAYAQSEQEHSVPIRALHLPYGVQWSWSLPLAPKETYDGRMLPMPAVSSESVALAYPSRRGGNGTSLEWTLVFLDKRAGRKVDTRILGAFAQANRIELLGLGEALFVLGKAPSSRGAALEILEPPR
jgi:outer membrane protein assembly factor BamB